MQNEIYNIQILRAIAVSIVVVFHACGCCFYGGNAGVDLFFVISGFIMVYANNISTRIPMDFLINRIIRIVPLYWLLTTIIVLSREFLPSLFNQNKDVPTIIYSYLFSTQLFTSSQPSMYVGWTLEYEMLFYIIFAVSLFANNIKYSVYLTSASLFLLAFIYESLILIEFLIGMAIGLYYIKFNSFKTMKYSIILTVIAISSFVLALSLGETNMNRLFLYGIPSGLVVLASLSVKQFKNKLLLTIGDASYSIYLVQVFSLPAIYKIGVMLSASYETLWGGYLGVIISSIFTIIMGIFLHKFFEIKITNKLKDMVKNYGKK